MYLFNSVFIIDMHGKQLVGMNEVMRSQVVMTLRVSSFCRWASSLLLLL